MPLRHALPIASVLALLLGIAAPPGYAGGYLKLSPGGEIYRWDNTSMLPLDLDGGRLGSLSEADAPTFVLEAISVWDQPTLYLGFDTSTGMLTADGDVNTADEFETLVGELVAGSTQIQNAVVFDDDGAVIEAHFGVGSGSGILGFALILGADDSTFEITHTVQVYNGECVENDLCGSEELTLEELAETIVHEQGHVLNLDHTQVNGHWFYGDKDDPGFVKYGDPPANAGAVNLMFPFYLPSSQYATEVGHDDLAAAEHLYGNLSSTTTGVISGTVFRSDGVTPLQGVNLIARNTDNTSFGSFYDATSSVSGYLFPTTPLAGGTPQPTCPDTTPPQLHGGFDLRGLTPGESYTVEAVAVNAQFDCGSSVGPLERPVEFPKEEFYSTDESSKDAIDPENFTAILVPTGSPLVSEIDLVQNCGSENETISAQSIAGFAYFDACSTLTVASNVEISGTGNAVFAADRVVFSSEFSVAAGGRLVVRPLLQ